MRRRVPKAGRVLLTCVLVLPTPALALERLCDPANENCRTPLIDLIRNERTGIDVGFWFMEDARYTYELINRFKAGVPVRVLVDPRANSSTPANASRLAELANAGIPMRKRIASGILHWKAMIFAGQRVVQFSGANYSGEAFKYVSPYTNYIDEAILFTSNEWVVSSFMTRFDDIWQNTKSYANYANVSGPLLRRYPNYGYTGVMNFPPTHDFGAWAVNEYNAETRQIDAIVYRITDRRHTDALIAARQRGVTVRLITEPKQYRDPSRLWHSWSVDRMYMAGIAIRHRAHAGLMHQKSTVLRGRARTIFGSSNWTTPSATSQEEHNYFTGRPSILQWFVAQFERKWNNSTGYAETTAFTPLPPDKPVYVSPANGTRVSGTVTLKWKPGYWAHKADVYFGTSSIPPLLTQDVTVSPNSTASLTISNLAAGRTYYWRIVSKTMANQTAGGAVWAIGS
ncbi:MAG TPA: phospholipase D-like domain-containing protein [Vicinamibacterales bacterium]|nr:phospholipase D-like domain-containing protein [Vicinamibacterales bacterium]